MKAGLLLGRHRSQIGDDIGQIGGFQLGVVTIGHRRLQRPAVAGDAGGIVVITQVQPISVIFTLPQQHLPTLTKALAAEKPIAQALSTDSQSELDAGTLQVIDNQVDQTTGTIRLKADFPNDKRQLWPGQFVNVKLKLKTLENAIVVSSVAIQQGANGSYVYLATPENTAKPLPRP